MLLSLCKKCAFVMNGRNSQTRIRTNPNRKPAYALNRTLISEHAGHCGRLHHRSRPRTDAANRGRSRAFGRLDALARYSTAYALRPASNQSVCRGDRPVYH